MRLRWIMPLLVAAGGCTSPQTVNLVPMQQTAPAPATGSSVPGGDVPTSLGAPSAAAAPTWGAPPPAAAPAPTPGYSNPGYPGAGYPAAPYPGTVGATPTLWQQMFGGGARPTAPPLVATAPGATSADTVVNEISAQVQQAIATGRIRPDEAAAIAQEAANKLRENNNAVGAGSRLARGDAGFRPASFESAGESAQGFVEPAVFRSAEPSPGEDRFRVSPSADRLTGRLEYDHAAGAWRLSYSAPGRVGEVLLEDGPRLEGFGTGERVAVAGRLAAGASWNETAPRFLVERIERLD